MCTSPRLVSRRSSTRCDFSTSLRFVDKDRFRVYRKLRPSSEDFFYNNYLVPCGHCSQCLKKRQSDLAARCAAEANKRGSMVFVTLTYDDVHLPLRVTAERVDKFTGEVSCPATDSLPLEFLEFGSDLDIFARGCLSKMDKRKSRYVYSDLFETDSELYRYCITPSLCRRDVQLWIKRCRVYYEREFKLPLKKFSYVCCGEYGPNTHRPHYHIAFFGLSKVVVDWMASMWKREKGFVYVQKVNAVNEDGSSGFELCSRYIGKYMSKGCFEEESVKCGASLKPRLMCSVGVGREEPEKVISDNLLAYYRCYDLVGVYDINDGKRLDGSFLSSSDYDLLAREVSKRSFFKIGSQCYPIPNVVKHYIWYEKNSNKSLVTSKVRREVSARLQTDLFEDFVRKLTKNYTLQSSSEIRSQISEFIICQNACDRVSEIRGIDALSAFYKNSKF